MILKELRELLLWLLVLPEEASTVAVRIDGLHFVIITVTFAGAAGVGLTAIYFIIKYRRRSHTETTSRVSISVPLELVLAGALLSFFIVSWVVGYRQYASMHRIPEDSLNVYVTAKQWMWKFAYPDGRSTAGVMVVPRDRKVKLSITSRDVIHSFYVPAFRIKQDAVPGRYTSIWFEATRRGLYRILCAEFCGQGHSQMWGMVAVLRPSDYQRWLQGDAPELVARAQQRAEAVGEQAPGTQAEADLVAQGLDAASRHGCLSCHTIDGQDHVGPTWRGLYGKEVELADGSTVVADEDYLTQSMMDPQEKVVKGYKQLMPSYSGVIAQRDVAPILELIKSLRSDSEPPPVQLPKTRGVPGTQGQPDAGLPGAGWDMPREEQGGGERPYTRDPAEPGETPGEEAP